VVANAVAALSEINESSPSGAPLVEMTPQTVNKLLTALNECTEWGQVFILDSLANYSPRDEREAQRYIFYLYNNTKENILFVLLAHVSVSLLVWLTPMLLLSSLQSKC